MKKNYIGLINAALPFRVLHPMPAKADSFTLRENDPTGVLTCEDTRS